MVSPLVAAELTLAVELRWNGAALAVPSEATTTAKGQRVQVTRLAALVSEFALVRAEGGTVQLPGQVGFFDAESGRLTMTLTGVPEGDYAGLEFSVGLPAETNHADPGRWAAGHPLNPIVNGLHWGWQGGFVFLALEGTWWPADGEGRGRVAGGDRGFSYHVATDARKMAVRFRADYRVAGGTTVKLAWEIARVLRDVALRADDGSESTHSAEGDALAAQLAQAAERSWFWLEAGATVGSTANAERHIRDNASYRGTPLAFVVPAGFPQPALPEDNALTREGVALGEAPAGWGAGCRGRRWPAWRR
jgi:hypothetical protein